LFEDLKVDWQAGEMRPQFPKFYDFIIHFRENHPELLRGDLVWVHNSDEQHVLSYLRHTKNEELLVAINLSNTPFRGTIEAAPGNWDEVNVPGMKDHSIAIPSLSLDAFGFRIFHRVLTPQSNPTIPIALSGVPSSPRPPQ
jgi:cyclomaltodextrinase